MDFAWFSGVREGYDRRLIDGRECAIWHKGQIAFGNIGLLMNGGYCLSLKDVNEAVVVVLYVPILEVRRFS